MHSRTIKLNTHNKVAAFAVEHNCTIQESQAALDKVQAWVDGNLDDIIDAKRERSRIKTALMSQLDSARASINPYGTNGRAVRDLANVVEQLIKNL